MNSTLSTAADTSEIRTVAVVGLGYVGLPTAAMFAKAGFFVTGVDIDSRVVDAVNRGEVLIFEPGLPEAVHEQLKSGRLSASRNAPIADAYVIAVPTPFRHDGMHTPDIGYIESAVRGIASVLAKGTLIILESTSPVGTTRHIINVLRSVRPDLNLPQNQSEGDIDFAYSPERVIPGKTMQELVSNDRVIGGVTPRAGKRARDLYKSFVRGECHVTDDKTAEMVKLAENTFRDVNIALANEFSILCDRFGIDVREMIELANQHPRVSILQPGAGVGGHCISVDPWFLVSGAPDLARLIRTARETNDYKPLYVYHLVEEAVEKKPNARVACLGLSYKPDIDDFRESPALDIALRLNARWPGRVVAVDPYGSVLPERDHRGGALTIVDYDAALEHSDVIVSLVPHSEFRKLPKPEHKVVIDAVGLWRNKK
ncbi:MAG: UDP-N-acetyl-D-mannosamine dehydrogenase [Rhizobiales bacterium]|nr:UDP-N-acetyl-D-mannosamine dehydrogenase [Hyphomicrobiales bacterium]